jgi:hypothetical protein
MSTKTNLWVDFLGFIGFLIAFEEKMTGVPIHEWLSMALLATVVLHLALHWRWVVEITARFFKNLFQKSRLNYVLNAILLVCFVAVMLSGLLISRSVLPFFGIQPGNNMIMKVLHSVSADGVILILAIHFALHWDWVWNALKKHVFAPIGRLFGRKQPAPQAVHAATPPAAKLPPTSKK